MRVRGKYKGYSKLIVGGEPRPEKPAYLREAEDAVFAALRELQRAANRLYREGLLVSDESINKHRAAKVAYEKATAHAEAMWARKFQEEQSCQS
jgi:hypothetical protein